MEADTFARDFFNGQHANVTTHEEWLLREYSRLMHREAELKQRESKFSSLTQASANEQTRPSTQHDSQQ